MLERDIEFVRLGRVERDALGVDVDRDRTVVDLVRDRERRVVVVRRADEPHVLRKREPALDNVLGVVGPAARDKVDDPVVAGRHFQNGQHFRKVVLDAGDVHFVQNGDVDVLVPGRLVHLFENFRLVEPLGEFVEVAEQLRTVAPRRLNGRDRRRIVEELPRRVRKRRLTGTGYTLQDQKPRRRHARPEKTDDARFVIEPETARRKVAETVADLLQSDVVVIFGRRVVFVNLVDFGQFEEAALARLLLFLALRRGALFALFERGKRLFVADRVHLHREDAILLARQFDDLLFEVVDLVQKVLVDDRLAEAADQPQKPPHDQPYQRSQDRDHQDRKQDRDHPAAGVPIARVDPKDLVVFREVEHLEQAAEYPHEYPADAFPQHSQKSLDEFKHVSHNSLALMLYPHFRPSPRT